MTDQYNTALSPQQEAQFQTWAKATGHAKDTFDYDLRGAWLANSRAAANGHLPDTFKKPNHPTFSVESQYNDPKNPAGSWVDLGNGKYKFVATPRNFQYQTPEELQGYFKKQEPDGLLVMPGDMNPGAAFEGAIQ